MFKKGLLKNSVNGINRLIESNDNQYDQNECRMINIS